MSTPPARCCAPATSGRCNNAPAPYGQSRYIGAVEIAACNHPKHQAALRSLPDFQRRAGVCGADDCGKAAESGLCPEHRQLYRRHGIDVRALLAQEATMTEPAPMPPAEPQEAADGGATPSPAVDAVEPSVGDVADAPLFVGGTDSAPVLSGRWGQVYTVSVQPMSPDLDGLAALAARGQQPTAPGPTLADVQAELARERERAIAAERTAHGAQGEVRRGREAVARLEKLLAGAEERADRAELDAVQERERADAAQAQLREAVAELATIAALLDPEDQPIPLPTRVQAALMPDTAYERELRKSLHAVEAELFEVDRTLQHLGAYGNGPTVDRLLKVLTPEDRRNVLEVQAAEARLDLARLKASRLNPPPPEKLAEYAAKVAEVEARIAALDAGDVRG